MFRQTRLAALSLALLSMQLATPLSSFAQGTCTVSALDTVAGLGTEVTISSCAKGLATTIVIQSPDNQNYTQNITLDAGGNATTLIPSDHTTIAGQYSVVAAEQHSTFRVLADHGDDNESSLIVSPKSIDADGKDTATVTAILRDRYLNPVTGRTLALIASRLTDDVTAESKQTDATGRFLWTVRSTENGTSSLTVYDIAAGRQMKLKTDLRVGRAAPKSLFTASLADFGQGGDVQADLSSEVIDHFELLLPQGATGVKANELFGVTIRAMRGTEIARGYIGTLKVKSSDADATLPKKGDDPNNTEVGRIEMRGVDQGERKVPLAFMLRNGGSQTIEVSDAQDPTITGKITLQVTGGDSAGGGGNITILDPADRTTIKGGPILLQGHAPSLVNLKVKGGSEATSGESDSEGVFRISVPINAADKEVTLFVTSENGTYESDPVHILIDADAPAIGSINFDPQEPKAGQTATITVRSEAGLRSVTASVETQNMTLTEGSGGLYSGLLSAPTKDGVYDVTVTAKDNAENTASALIKWTVKPATIARVQHVTAKSERAAVLVRWDALADIPLKEYKIYIAAENEPQNYLYSIGTQKPVTSATIKDLPLGRTYLFSLTAIAADGTESPEKSEAAAAAPLGIDLKVTPGKDSLMLDWTPLPSLPLDRYILQYGTEPGNYTERRTINGQAVSYALHDLIGGITYELKLTPVTVTGKELDEMAVTMNGTPTSGGFVAGANDPVPSDLLPLHSGAPLDPRPSLQDVPSNAGSGIPTSIAAFLILFSLGIGLHLRSARIERRRTEEFLDLMRTRYHS